MVKNPSPSFIPTTSAHRPAPDNAITVAARPVRHSHSFAAAHDWIYVDSSNNINGSFSSSKPPWTTTCLSNNISTLPRWSNTLAQQTEAAMGHFWREGGEETRWEQCIFAQKKNENTPLQQLTHFDFIGTMERYPSNSAVTFQVRQNLLKQQTVPWFVCYIDGPDTETPKLLRVLVFRWKHQSVLVFRWHTLTPKYPWLYVTLRPDSETPKWLGVLVFRWKHQTSFGVLISFGVLVFRWTPWHQNTKQMF